MAYLVEEISQIFDRRRNKLF